MYVCVCVCVCVCVLNSGTSARIDILKAVYVKDVVDSNVVM